MTRSDRSSWHKALLATAAVAALTACATTTQSPHVEKAAVGSDFVRLSYPSAPHDVTKPSSSPHHAASHAHDAAKQDAADPAGRLAGKVIVIDPGHQLGNSTHQTQINRLVNAGGFMKACNTTGTSTNGGFPESTFAWDVALGVRSRLVAVGAKVYLTRFTNSLSHWGPCIDTRGRLGNRVHADAALSIHGDGAAPQYRGFFVIMPGHRTGWTNDIYQSSHRLGAVVHGALIGSGAVVANDYGGTGYDVRTDLGTLNWSDVPIVMVELGNMRNATDAGHMTSPTYRSNVYAHGLAVGLARYVLAP